MKRWTSNERGWLRGTLSGEEAFSDGSAMFIGKRKGAKPLKGRNSFQQALRKLLMKRLQPTQLERIETIGPKPYTFSCARLRGGTYVDEKYWRHACTFKNVEFYLGKRVGPNGERALICKVGNKIVGAVMPVRTPKTE